MHSKRTLLLFLFATLAAAQSAALSFTRVPNPITDGEPAVLLWSTNDTSSPVTITLRKGPAANLDTVYVITKAGTDGQYIWRPSLSTANGDDYALEISQGSQVNYFGPFTIQGASPSAVASASLSSSISAANTSVTTVTASAGTGTPMSRNTTIVNKTKPQTNQATTTRTTVGGQGASGTSGAATSSTSAAAAPADLSVMASSSLALLFGAAAALFYLQ